MAGMDDTLTPDDVFVNPSPEDQEKRNSSTVSALLSPRMSSKFERQVSNERSSSTKDMLLQFAESVEQCLIYTHERLYNSADVGRVTKQSFTSHDMVLKENLFDFKKTLRAIRASQDTMSFESIHRCSQGSIFTKDKTQPMGCYVQGGAGVRTDSTPNDEIRGQKADSSVTLEQKMKPWIELTHVDVDPKMPPRRLVSTASTVELADSTSLSSDTMSRLSDHGKQSAKKQLSDFTYSNLVTPATAHVVKHPDMEHVCFSFQFLIITERLKVTVKHAENLFKAIENENEANSFAEVCLIPGKVQVQTTELVRKTKNPQYKSLFYFKGFSLQEMHQMHLRIRLMAKRNILHRPRIIGEVVVSLENFDLVSETVLDELLHTRIVPGQRGSIRHVLVK